MTSTAPDEADSVPAASDPHCLACDYNLRGITTDRCPECGFAVDPASPVAAIPWLHRRRIGRFRAYWRTVWLATVDPKRLGRQVASPVPFEDAKRFQRVTVALAWSAAAGVLLRHYVASFDAGNLSITTPAPGGNNFYTVFELLLRVKASAAWTVAPKGGWVAEFATVIAALVGWWLFFTALSGVGSYFFHPRRLHVVRQNRAVAISYYACAPLALLPVAAMMVLGAEWATAAQRVARPPWPGGARAAVQWLWIAACALPVLIALVFHVNTLRLLTHATGCGASRRLPAMLVLPLCWALLFALTAIGLPAAVAYVGLIVLSLGP